MRLSRDDSVLRSLNVSDHEPVLTLHPVSKASTAAPSDVTSSKAIATAMQALQQRNRDLESEQTRLEAYITELEQQLSYERNQFEATYADEISHCSQKEGELSATVKALEIQLEESKTTNFNLEQEICHLKSKLAAATTEKNQMSDQFEIEKESWVLQIDILSNKLAKYTDYQHEFEDVSEQLNKEKQELRDELVETHHSLDHLKQEFQNFKRLSDAEKENLVRFNEEVVQSRDFYAKECKGIKIALKSTRARVSELTSDSQQLRARLDAMENEQSNLQTEKLTRESFIQDIVNVNDKLIATLNQKSKRSRVHRRRSEKSFRHTNPLRNTPRRERQSKDENSVVELEAVISELEHTIEQQNRRYESLMSQATLEGVDQKRLRSQLSQLTEEMQINGEKLERARRKLSRERY